MAATTEKATVQSDYFADTVVKGGKNDASLRLNGEEVEFRAENGYPQIVTITRENKEYPCIITVDSQGDVIVSYCGYTYPVRVYSPKEQALRQIINASETAANSTIKIAAPMPGLIKTVFAASGSKVKKGETLFLLEAMKMENSLKSPVAGTVTDIHVREGDAVEKSFHLCSVKPG